MVRDRARAGVVACVSAAALVLVGCPDDRRGIGNGERLTHPQVIGAARAINVGEIDYVVAAQGRLVDPQVSSLADRVLQDHRTALQALEQVTVQMGLVPEESDISRDLRDDVNDRIQGLAGEEGEDLRDQFMDDMVQKHERSLQRIDDDLLPSTTDPTLQQYLADLRGLIAAHLEEARMLRDRREDGGMGTGDQWGTERRDEWGTDERDPTGTGTQQQWGTEPDRTGTGTGIDEDRGTGRTNGVGGPGGR
ncbi:MAG: DUF4142 domain-containing protein [Planctomycetes bacterium]|nr:DUF4142 domain-containing protein [Planctomycetota bacterium]